MGSTKIKLCGLSRIEDIDAVNELLPEYVGFVFFKKSIRNVSFETAQELKDKLSPKIKAVGVFVNEDISFIKNLVDEKIIDLVQLHGNETEDYISKLKEKVSVPVIKAIQIKEESSFTSSLCENADYYLLDSGMGTGSTFDWNIIKDKIDSLGKVVFLAGGLDPDNVATAIENLNPYAVDVSSGIETNKVKDIDKMRRFVNAARRISNE